MRAHDWSASPLGEPGTWPPPLGVVAGLMLGSAFPMFAAWGPELGFLYNDAYSAMLGARHPDALGRPFREVWPEIWDEILPFIERAMSGEATYQEDLPLRMERKGFAEDTSWTFSYSPIRDVDGTVRGMFCACVETTEAVRSRSELADLNVDLERQVLDRSREFKHLWDTSPDLLLVIDFLGVFRKVNPAWTTLLGYAPEELVGRHVSEFILPEDDARTRDAYEMAAGGGLPVIENRYRHKDGSIRWLSWVAAPNDGVTYAIGRDVTARVAAQEELATAQDALRQSQKLEAVGQLTGGVAHDFNNLLTVIKSSTDLLKRPGLPEERRTRYVGAISDTVDRAAKLTGQLLAFARRQALKPEVFAACDSVRSLSDMMGTLTGSRIEIVTDLPETTCFVHADPSQFDTALVNMAVNARDAMDGEGRLVVRVRAVEGMPAIRAHAAVTGGFVAVSISDTGTGIPADRLEQIFEPFFTTKGVGQGTGLGLSQVFGFAKQSGGEVTVESEVGRGTTFTLYLPRVAEEARTADAGEPEPLMDGHGTCVLVVEDNAEVGTFAVQTLSDMGYVTVLANNAEEALAELAQDADRFDVVFSDVVMPGMNGIDLAHRIREKHHDLPVLLASGYSHVLAQNGTYGFELLHKPYSVEQLSRLLRKVATWQRRRRILDR
ncbi:PAS domain-containing protein [Methylobacterium sp. J-059]|uniref:hybrid sensor histidine kinase/response regulator n=1 Tax=Methylobacterium sp. J-059 TaxID=2836643 RepID=UPI001FB9D3B8|nr:PAS domain-containing sensor histidine kinase [Methylobacterium sp. J-059]MCJ2040925.1 PAS domain-containing protein [Methylobacterium sp. J-059]